MLLKNASIMLVNRLDVGQLGERLGAALFEPCTASQPFSHGFVPVFEDQLLFHSHGHYLLKFMFEKKVLPKSAINAVVKARAEELEEQQGFAPGKKMMKQLREDATDELLARALTTTSSTYIWIDTHTKRLIIDSTSNPMVDRIVSALIKHGEGDLTLCRPWPGKQLVSWLLDDGGLPEGFTVDDSVTLEYPGDRGMLVAYRKANLDTPEVAAHLAAGAQVTSMAMTYKSRVSFVMTPLGQVRSIKALDILDDVQVAPDADLFENNFYLAASELQAVLTDIFAAAGAEEED